MIILAINIFFFSYDPLPYLDTNGQEGGGAGLGGTATCMGTNTAGGAHIYSTSCKSK